MRNGKDRGRACRLDRRQASPAPSQSTAQSGFDSFWLQPGNALNDHGASETDHSRSLYRREAVLSLSAASVQGGYSSRGPKTGYTRLPGRDPNRMTRRIAVGGAEPEISLEQIRLLPPANCGKKRVTARPAA